MSLDRIWKLLISKGKQDFDNENGHLTLFHGEGDLYDIYPVKIVLSSFKVGNGIPNNFSDIERNVKEIQFKGDKGSEYDVDVFEFPNYASRFCNLIKLDISDQKLEVENIRSVIFNLKSLEHLGLLECGLETIPNEIINLTNLKSLDLSSNLITELPDAIFSLLSLNTLELGGNKILNLSTNINNLTQLRGLSLTNNKLTSFPEIRNDDMRLEELSLEENNIKTLPNSISKLKSLLALDISFNTLLSLPDNIGDLTKLKVLYCHYNSLTFLPDSITQLKSLINLNIQGNKLSSLPDNIGQLNQLKDFRLSNNSITYLPESITKLSLDEFNVRKNPLQKPPYEICVKGLDAVKGYFEALNKFTGFHSNRSKIILFGESMAGKTSLCRALINCKEEQINVDCRTEGVDLYKWKIRPEIDDLEVLVVDCAGQRKYMITHSFFISQGCLFLLVLDLYNYQPTIEYYRKNVGNWISVILAHAPDATVLLVPTHLDLFESDSQITIQQKCKHVLKNVWEDVHKREKDLEASGRENLETKNQFSSSFRAMNVSGNWKKHISAVFQLGDELLNYSDSTTTDLMKMIPVSSFGKLDGISDLRKELIKILTNSDVMPLVGQEIPTVYSKLEEYCVSQRLTTPVIKLEDFIETVEVKFSMTKEMIISALQYFDTIGSVLYFSYGKEFDQFLFLDPEWFIIALKKVFNHNNETNLKFKDAFIQSYNLASDDFMQLKEDLLESGRLSTKLLRCIWSDIADIIKNDSMFYFLIEILCRFNLVINIGNQNDWADNPSMMLLVPWYFKPATEDLLQKHWPEQKEGETVEIISQFNSIVSPLPVGSFERFVASIYHEFSYSVAWQDAFLGIEINCKVYCTIQSDGRCGKLILRGRCRYEDIDDLWKSLLPIFKIADGFFKYLPGLGCIKRQSLCPSCFETSDLNPYKFDIPCWFSCDVKKDYIPCGREHKLIPVNMIFPPTDIVHGFKMKNGNEIEVLQSIPNCKVDLLMLDEISQLVGTVPRSLGRCLGLPNHRTEQICYDNRFENVAEQNFSMLTTWIQHVGRKATVIELYKCILSMKPKQKAALIFIRDHKYQTK